jgi:hypothetical protein
MRTFPTLPIVVVFAGMALPVLQASCSPRSCQDAEHELYRRLEECQVDYFIDAADVEVCTDVERQLAECRLSCLGAVSCEAVRGEAGEERTALAACEEYCRAFIFQAIPDEELSK